MNLVKFLSIVDEETANCSKEQLSLFLHEYARTMPENQREIFLAELRRKSRMETLSYVTEHSHKEVEKLAKRVAELKEKLVLIDSGDLCLDSDYNVEYDEWYNDEEEEFIFSDPEGIMKVLQESCELVHECVDKECYREAFELADCLLALSIDVEGAYADYGYDVLRFNDLNREGLLSYSIKLLVKDAVFAAYQVTKPEKRAEEVYRVLINSECVEVTLQDLFQMGKQDLQEWEDFLEKWISCLNKKRALFAQVLIVEAVDMLNDFDKEWECAKKYKDNHPELYARLFEKKEYKGRTEELLEVGREALSGLAVDLEERSRIALYLADLCGRRGMKKSAEKCWLEAFRSDITVVNFMRLYEECENFTEFADKTAKIYPGVLKRKKAAPRGDSFFRNGMEERIYYILAFFHKQFQTVLDKGMNTKEVLGWSATFMKQGLALFLLYLYRGEELQEGGRKLCRELVSYSNFSTAKYNEGLGKEGERTEESEVLFWNLFNRWKKENPIEEEAQKKLVSKMEAWIEKRIQGIMSNNCRNYYGECAAFVAALGEVKESMGIVNGKAVLMLAYKQAYSRRSAFHGELRAYGMKDGKKR